MLNKKTVGEFFTGAQNTRVALRHITCLNGFCLIVEDDRHVARYLEKILKKQNMATRVVSTAKEALDIISTSNKDIICAIVDLNLESKDAGQMVVEKFEKEYRSIPYVVYTGERQKETTLKRKYPHINVAIKGRNNTAILLNALGIV